MYCLKVDYHTCSFLNGQIIILNRFLKQFVLKKLKTLIGSLYYFLNLASRLYGILCTYYVHQNYIILLCSKYAFGKAFYYLQKQCFEKRFENMISRFSKLQVLSLFFMQSLFVKFLFSFYKWVRSKKNIVIYKSTITKIISKLKLRHQ